jgi:hypothetical protein
VWTRSEHQRGSANCCNVSDVSLVRQNRLPCRNGDHKRGAQAHFRRRQVAPNSSASTSSDNTASILPWRFITASSASASPGAYSRSAPSTDYPRLREKLTFHHSKPHTSSNSLNRRLRQSYVPNWPATRSFLFRPGLLGPSNTNTGSTGCCKSVAIL